MTNSKSINSQTTKNSSSRVINNKKKNNNSNNIHLDNNDDVDDDNDEDTNNNIDKDKSSSENHLESSTNRVTPIEATKAIESDLSKGSNINNNSLNSSTPSSSTSSSSPPQIKSRKSAALLKLESEGKSLIKQSCSNNYFSILKEKDMNGSNSSNAKVLDSSNFKSERLKNRNIIIQNYDAEYELEDEKMVENDVGVGNIKRNGRGRRKKLDKEADIKEKVKKKDSEKESDKIKKKAKVRVKEIQNEIEKTKEKQEKREKNKETENENKYENEKEIEQEREKTKVRGKEVEKEKEDEKIYDKDGKSKLNEKQDDTNLKPIQKGSSDNNNSKSDNNIKENDIDSGIEETEVLFDNLNYVRCTHLKQIQFERVKKKIEEEVDWKCDSCSTQLNVYICLSCGSIGCSDYKRHCSMHNRLTNHSLILDIHQKNCYCYTCNNYVKNDTPSGDIDQLRQILFSTSFQKSDNKPIEQQIAQDDIEETAFNHFQMSMTRRLFRLWKLTIKNKNLQQQQQQQKQPNQLIISNNVQNNYNNNSNNESLEKMEIDESLLNKTTETEEITTNSTKSTLILNTLTSTDTDQSLNNNNNEKDNSNNVNNDQMNIDIEKKRKRELNNTNNINNNDSENRKSPKVNFIEDSDILFKSNIQPINTLRKSKPLFVDPTSIKPVSPITPAITTTSPSQTTTTSPSTHTSQTPPTTPDSKSNKNYSSTYLMSKVASSPIKQNGIIPGVTGLRNLGNTCYMNTVLQSLSNIPEFRRFFVRMNPFFSISGDADGKGYMNNNLFLDDDPLANPTKRQSTMECLKILQSSRSKQSVSNLTLKAQLHSLFRNLWSGKCSVLSPHGVLSAVWRLIPKFACYQQQDAQEFLSYLLDCISNELNPKPPKKPLPAPTPASKVETIPTPTPKVETKSVPSPAPTPTPKVETKTVTTFRPLSKRRKQPLAHEFIVPYSTDENNNSPILSNATSTSADSTQTKTTSSTTDTIQTTTPTPPIDSTQITNNQDNIKNEDIVSKLFQGKLKSQITCLNCMNTVEVLESFLEFTLDVPVVEIPKKKRGRKALGSPNHNNSGSEQEQELPQFKIEDCIGQLVKKELLDGKSYKCSKCNELQDAEKKFSIHTLPDVLCIVLKRFRWKGNSCLKIETDLNFPFELDLTPFIDNDITVDNNNKCENNNNNDKNNNKENDKDNISKEKQSNVFELLNVINHHGSVLYGGHYTAYCFNDLQEIWAHFNDGKVTIVAAEDVLEASKSTAYILFYQRKTIPKDTETEI